MDFMTAVKTCFGKYVTFSGRAQRSEFWWFFLAMIAGSVVMTIVDSIIGLPIFGLIWTLGTILPGISVAVRRLHDLDKSGWWYWIGLVPIVGFILLIVWFATKGTDGENTFGDDPMGGVA